MQKPDRGSTTSRRPGPGIIGELETHLHPLGISLTVGLIPKLKTPPPPIRLHSS